MSTKKAKYYFNTNTLRYEKIEIPWSRVIFQIFGFLCAAIVFGMFFLFLAYKFIDSPKEKILRNEIEGLKQNYDKMVAKSQKMEQVLLDLEIRDDNIYRSIFGSSPIPKSIRDAGVGGNRSYEGLEKYDNEELMKHSFEKLDEMGRKMAIQSKSYDEITKLIKNKEEMLASIPAIQPISNVDLTRIASGFGMRIDPIYKTGKMHNGIDFTSPTGTPIYATGNGYVEKIEFSARGYGNHVVINHGYGYASLYAHMSKIIVYNGQKLKRGDVIGYVGSSGKSTGAHLHYEVIYNSEKIDPINFFHNDLTPDQYNQMLILSNQSNQSFD